MKTSDTAVWQQPAFAYVSGWPARCSAFSMDGRKELGACRRRPSQLATAIIRLLRRVIPAVSAAIAQDVTQGRRRPCLVARLNSGTSTSSLPTSADALVVASSQCSSRLLPSSLKTNTTRRHLAPAFASQHFSRGFPCHLIKPKCFS
jgi:hypothetical protein